MPRSALVNDMQPEAPRSRKGAATRARLLDSAKEEFEADRVPRNPHLRHRQARRHVARQLLPLLRFQGTDLPEVAEAQEALLNAPDDGAPPAADATEFDRILRANRRYLDRYRANGKIMGVIEEVSRYDTFVNEARIKRQKHFAERAEASVRRLQAEGVADLDIDPAIAAVALGSMIARFAELWLVEGWADYPFDHAAEQVTRSGRTPSDFRRLVVRRRQSRPPPKKSRRKKS